MAKNRSMYNPLNIIDRSSPLAWIFLIALIAIIIGALFYALVVIAVIGALIVIIYILYLVLWLRNNLP